MEKNSKFAVLVVWFGSFPTSFDMWLASIQYQPFDFIFVTDQKQPKECLKYKWHSTSLAEIKEKISEIAGFSAELSFSYKLCDYKPAYGEIFANLIAQYEYWGHCDLDMVFGNCSSIVLHATSEKPDKIYQRGHLSFYKNTEEINSIYRNSRIIDYKYIFRSNKICMFDEWHGIGKIFREKNKTVFHEETVIDIMPNSILFKPAKLLSRDKQIFIYRQGNVIQYFLENEELGTKSYNYIHFQKRRIDFSAFSDPDNSYIFTSNKIIDLGQSEVLPLHVHQYNKMDIPHFLKRFVARTKMKLRLQEIDFDQYVMHQNEIRS